MEIIAAFIDGGGSVLVAAGSDIGECHVFIRQRVFGLRGISLLPSGQGCMLISHSVLQWKS